MQATSGWQGMKPKGRSLTLSPRSITHLYGVFRRRLQSPPTAIVTDGSGDKGPGLQRDIFLLGRIKEETERGCYLVFGAEQSDAGTASAIAFPFPCLSFPSGGKLSPQGDSEEHLLRMEENSAEGGVGSTNASCMGRAKGQGWGAQLGGPHSCNPCRGDFDKVVAIKNKREGFLFFSP